MASKTAKLPGGTLVSQVAAENVGPTLTVLTMSRNIVRQLEHKDHLSKQDYEAAVFVGWVNAQALDKDEYGKCLLLTLDGRPYMFYTRYTNPDYIKQIIVDKNIQQIFLV